MVVTAFMRVLLLSGAVALTASPVSADDPMAALKIARVAPGTAATPFDLKTLDGRSVQLADLKGKVVLVNFWATWCGPCKEEMPGFERLRQRLDPERFALVTITTDLQRDGIKHFLTNLNVQLPVLFDEDQDVSRAYLVRALPTTVLIDRQGTVVGRAVGPREWDAPKTIHLLQGMTE
ncbi:MAG: TlpA disulfide reductase family protein [Nitrospira sp.]|jgi:thiol-disulfide isomerase/thioredoxin|nr:MAG: TlpA disulfide reductase family protein [Nitrospira sp.]